MRMMGAESVAYHRETVIGRADDHPGLAREYYAFHGETPLTWGGSGAAAFGLVGAVTDEQYDNVFGPGGFRDPTTGTRLVETKRPGIELVVSAHKSVALLGVIGFAEEMHAILDAETDATLGFLDAWIRRAGGRRGRAQLRTPTEGLVHARTRHATSRAGDPEPHDHVLVANVVEMLDERGGRKALDTAVVRDLLHAATMVGRMAGARTAVEFGFAIEPDTGPSGKLGHWCIRGIPEQACALFSKRSAEIDASIEARGLVTYQARQVAARDTRRAKRHQPVAELMPTWHAELEAAGLAVEDLQHGVVVAGQERASRRRLDDDAFERLAEQVLGPGGRLAELKVFTRADVIVAVAPALYGLPEHDLDRAVAGVLGHPEAIPLVGVAAAREQAYAPACVVAVEAAIVASIEAAAARTTAPSVPGPTVERAIWAKEAALGRPLTVGQTNAVVGICTSGRGVEVVLGVAGAGKTTMLDVVRAGFEYAGYRVVGTATSGQAARTLGREAGLAESRTAASLLWRIDHERLKLDDRTVLIVDEAAMTDDPALLRLLTAADAAGAKTILVGDHRQLGAVGPSGALEGLTHRFPDVLHALRQNVRQVDPEERTVLAHLRAGDVAHAVDWYLAHDRVRVAGTRSDALEQVVDGWLADVEHGRDTAMYAWRRANVAELNHIARQRWVDVGRLRGVEIEVPGGRRYAAGDRIVTLAPGTDGALVTSEHGTVDSVDPARGQLVLRMADDRIVGLDVAEAGADRIDYGYALTVHRSQGDTTQTAHRFADGGGRELGYVSMSRATTASTVYVVADDLEQARGDLVQDWSHDRRQRWAIDTGTPTTDPAEIEREPDVHEGLRLTIRRARLESERHAVTQAIPPDVTGELREATRQLHWLRQQRHDLETGTGSWQNTTEGRAAFDLRTLQSKFDSAEHRGGDRRLRFSERRSAWREARALEARVASAAERWTVLAGGQIDRLTNEIDATMSRMAALQEHVQHRDDWLAEHPEALRRLERLDREIQQLQPPQPSVGVDRVVGLEPPTRSHYSKLGGPELGL
jgi:conjugative relaxase-like TrwC/TraI family protein